MLVFKSESLLCPCCGGCGDDWVAAAAAEDAVAVADDGALAILQVEKPNGDGGD